MLLRLAENFRAVFYAPFYAAIELGFCASEGVDVRLVEQATPGGGTAGLLDGTLDVTWGGPMRAMKARDDGGPPLICFCEVVRRDPFYLVARSDIGDRQPFRLTDLARLRIGTVSEVPTPWLCLQHDLREAGVDPGSLRRAASATMAENIAALERGELDVVQVFEPYAASAERTRIGRIVHAASARGDTAYTTLLTLKENLAGKRPAFAALARAIRSMQIWLAGASGTELAAAVSRYYPNVDRADLATALTRYKEARLWADTTDVSEQGFDRLARSLVTGGFIRTVPPYSDCVVNEA